MSVRSGSQNTTLEVVYVHKMYNFPIPTVILYLSANRKIESKCTKVTNSARKLARFHIIPILVTIFAYL